MAFAIFVAFSATVSGAVLQIQIAPTVNGQALQPASFRYHTCAGETFSITRVSYLVSEVALQHADGSWLGLSNSVAWLDYAQGRNSFRLDGIPSGEYRSIRFAVGLNTNLNHSDIAQFASDHPLNPNLDSLHWSWQGGYIFLALEGLWRNAAGELDGWSYHLARDGHQTFVTLAAPLEITNETRLTLNFDLAVLLNAPRPLSFGRDGSSTHSREGDPVAAALVENLPGAFSVSRITELSRSDIALAHPQPLYLPKTFTPYPFQLSASFPKPELPHDNPLTIERVALGKKLFFDKSLSGNNQQSCADCHSPQRAFTDGREVARGAEGDPGTRNSMPLFNLAWKSKFFWDGRASSLREQVLQPIENPIEMNQPLTNLVAKLQSSGGRHTKPGETTDAHRLPASAATSPDYPAMFTTAFGSPAVTVEKIALALESYLLTLTSFDSRFDRVMRGEEKFTPSEQRGFVLFNTEYNPRRGQYGADCFHCHGGPLFQSQSFANNGLDATFTDPGRAKVTRKAADAGKFATPSLRNVALTAPYMHDGRFQTLEEAVAHYCTGMKRSATLDPNLAKHPDGGVPLSDADQHALVAFLRTLTDPAFSRVGSPPIHAMDTR